MLHPDIAIPLASLCSGKSREYNLNRFTEKKKKEYFEQAKNYLKKGYDIIVMAHTHIPVLYDISGKYYCNTGEWMKQYSFAVLQNGSITLCRFMADTSSVIIAPDK